MDAGELLTLIAGIVRWGLMALGVFLVIATVLAETRLPHWSVRMWDFPRSQIALLLVILAVLVPLVGWLAATWSWWTLLASLVFLVCAARQGMWIWPYVGPAENDIQITDAASTDPNAVKIVISNLLQGNDKYELWRTVIGREDADVIVCAEATQQWVREIGRLLDATHPPPPGRAARQLLRHGHLEPPAAR